MMPSAPSATDLTAAASVTIENTMSAAAAAARGCRRKAHPGLDQRLGLVLAAVPAGDRVAGRHEPGDDACAHGAEPDETDVHSFTSQRAGCWQDFAKREAAMMTKKSAEG